MLTYMGMKRAIEDSWDLGELALNLLLVTFMIVIDIATLPFQPIYYIAYKKWRDDNK